MLMRVLPIVLCAMAALWTAAPCEAADRTEKKARMTMAEKKELARQAGEARREAARQKAEERRLKNRSKAEREADEAAAQQAVAEQRHAEEVEEAQKEAKRQRAEQERRETLASQEKSAAIRARLRFRKAAIARFDVKKGEEWTVHTPGLKAFALLDEAQKYVKYAAENEQEAREFAEELEEDTMILVSKGGHLTVKATNADSILPTVGDMREPAEGEDAYTAFDTLKGASAYLKQAAQERGLVRVLTRRKDEFWVLYRDLLEMATPPEREEEPEPEEETPAAEEPEDDGYEYGDDLV